MSAEEQRYSSLRLTTTEGSNTTWIEIRVLGENEDRKSLLRRAMKIIQDQLKDL
jgi:hypothetical protein